MTAIAIFGTANAVTKRITEIGAENLIDGRNPISFCNVLFVGNLCALILLSVIYQKQWRWETLKKINKKSWLAMTFVAIIGAAIVPTMIFSALAITAVNNVVLIGQIDTPLVLFLSVLFLSAKVNRWVIAGAILAFFGVSLTVLLQPSGGTEMTGLMIGRGEVLVLVAAVLKAFNNLITKITLEDIPLGIFSTFRMMIGTIAFFIATNVLYGPHHFMDVATPFLWRWMFIYSGIIVVGGQLLWLSGLKLSTASEVSLATAFNPLVGVLAAYFVLGDAPTTAQYIGGVVILIGIAFNQVGVQKINAMKNIAPPTQTEMSESVPFKGV
ncbi:MAG: DMT family transporter [Limnothrix sp. RL_2_0]|nr:DMT family transporter [Limnothrix sp. RL_2_0]